MTTGPSTNNGTMISYSEGTMVQHDTGPGTAQSKTMSEIGKFSPAKICVCTIQYLLFTGDLFKAQWALLMVKVQWMKT